MFPFILGFSFVVHFQTLIQIENRYLSRGDLSIPLWHSDIFTPVKDDEMKRKRLCFQFFSIFLLIIGLSAAESEAIKNFSLKDQNGQLHSIRDYKGKWVVLEWVNFGCPFVKKFYKSGKMQSWQAEYASKGVIWLSICSSAQGKQGYFEGADLLQKIKSEGMKSSAYLIDEKGKVGRQFNAKTTPHMVIIDPSQKVSYAGAVDSIPSANIDDISKAKNYLTDALEALLNGKKPLKDKTIAYGCSVKYKK